MVGSPLCAIKQTKLHMEEQSLERERLSPCGTKHGAQSSGKYR